MSATYVTQDRVEREAQRLVGAAERTLDIASPWVEGLPVERLLEEALPRIRRGELRVRLVYRVSDESDLVITDLAALERLADAGVAVRYSRRLHAKLLVADSRTALVGSSNLTRRGGYGYERSPAWRNEEGSVLLEDDEAAAQAAAHFETIWEGADEILPELLGVVMDFPTVREFRFVAIRDVRIGQLVCASGDGEAELIGEVVELTAYNQSFPQMTEEMFLTQGLGGAPPRRVTVPDLPSLFSHPVKDQGFLVAKTFFQPESAFQIGRVRVLRSIASGRPATATAPIAPGSDVRLPSPSLLRLLSGGGDLRLGRMRHHEQVGVWVDSRELLTKHLAVLGMTGSGKSNAVKHLLRELAPAARGLRVFVVDTHGEYAACADAFETEVTRLDVSIPDRINLLDFDMVKEHFAIDRMTTTIKRALRAAANTGPDLAAVATALAQQQNDTLQDIAAQVLDEPDRFCVGAEAPRVMRAGAADDAPEASLDAPGLYVLDLRETATFEVRARKCAVLCERVFAEAKRSSGTKPALVVVDEAHNYVPERTTGFMAEASRHGSLHALTTIAVEGRKFNVGLVLSSQRPSRVAKDVLAQANSQLIFRLANLEDLQYVRESFEAAGAGLLADLPQLDTGVCIAAGTMLAMPLRCDVPLFARRHRYELPPEPEAPDREAVAAAVRAVVPDALALATDDAEGPLYTAPGVEVTLGAANGQPLLEVCCDDSLLAERVRDAVARALAQAGEEER